MRGARATAAPRLRILTGRHEGLNALVEAGCVPIIAHAGLAAHRVGKAPNRESLRRARALGVATVEIDVVASREGDLVLHHDLTLPTGERISSLSLDDIRQFAPDVLTLEDAAAELGDDIALVLDVKSVAAAKPLASWLNNSAGQVAVCSDRSAVLRELSESAPATELWRTFPYIGVRPYEHVWRVMMSLLAHRGTGAVGVAADLLRTVRRFSNGPREALHHLSGVPWRHSLPGLLPDQQLEFGIHGITVHHPLITRELCDAAHALGLWVIAWTVNDPVMARRAIHAGADMITTDRVEEIGEALRGF